MRLAFTSRSALFDYEWERTQSFANRNQLGREVLQTLAERSNLHGFLRVGLYSGAMLLLAWATVAVSHHSLWLAIPILYAYWFLYGFWVAVGHELQHKMVFAKSWERLSEALYFLVQTLMWNSPRYARISHNILLVGVPRSLLAAVMLAHAAVVALAIGLRRWEPILFVTIAWQIGGSQSTKTLLCTR